jgi:nicotinamide N-methyltransferase
MVTVEGHRWGDFATSFAAAHQGHYTRVLAADTLWLICEQDSLARSMTYFLSKDPSARILVIAGFHTGRAKMAAFFEKAVPENGLEMENIFEIDATGRQRIWHPQAPEEAIGERKKWLVVARLKRKQ